MSSLLAKRLLENWFKHVWVLADVSHMEDYYAAAVQGEFNRNPFTRENLEEHCAWCKKNEKITEFEIADVVAEGNKIAFRVRYRFIDQHGKPQEAENMGIFHLDKQGKIAKIWVKSSEQFGKE
jgi:hypothetical protein